MANEVTVNLSLGFNKPGVTLGTIGQAVTGLLATVNGSAFAQGTISVATSPTAIPIGPVTTPHWCYFVNFDSTNYVTLQNGAGGAPLPELGPGEEACFPISSTAVPYATANTAAVLLGYLIISL